MEKDTIYYAHRGLHDDKKPENSILAFKEAIKNGYGIEFDVQKTKDNVLLVFHDNNIQRVCGIDKKITESKYSEIKAASLSNSRERIPKLEEAVKCVDGKVPLLVEIKSEGNWKKTTIMTAKLLKKYKGPYMVQSFNPMVVRKYKKLCPDITCGLLASDFFKDKTKKSFIVKMALSKLWLYKYSKADFLNYNHNYFEKRIIKKHREKGGRLAYWTIRSKGELAKLKGNYDFVVFENFRP